jgi:hypothetical protein
MGAARDGVDAEMKSEHDEQAAVVYYLQVKYPDVLFWANSNGAYLAGGTRQRCAQMNKLKAEGFLPGVSDMTIFEPRGGYSSMFLEMKRADGGSGASENQLWFIREVEKRGAFGIVCDGADEAIEILENYLGGQIIRP